MKKILQAESTLTDRDQGTIEDNGKVFISRAIKNDSTIGDFLNFLATDIKNHPSHVHSLNQDLVVRTRKLISGIEVDLNAPLEIP